MLARSLGKLPVAIDPTTLLSSWARCWCAGTQRPRRKQFSGCRASARQPDGAEGEEAADYTNFSRSLNDEWQKRRSCGDLYHSLAEQDRHWAAGHLESFTSIELDSSITTTLDDPRDMDERLAHSSRSWGARSITYSPNPPQPPWSAEKGSTVSISVVSRFELHEKVILFSRLLQPFLLGIPPMVNI